jgi:hypothetical protein
LAKSNDGLVGKKVVAVRGMTSTEMRKEGWDTTERATVIEFDDGTKIFASQDEEGNGPGTLFGVKGREQFRLLARS